jgi:hypothetical protein
MDRPRRIVVELDPGADPIAGRVCTDGERTHAFTGWTGLFAALRTATGDDGRRDAATGSLAAEPGSEEPS